MLPLYERIEELCRGEGITVTELCRRAGVSRSAMSDYKTGRKKSVSLNNVLRISEYFDIPVEELMEGESGRSRRRLAGLPDNKDPYVRLFRVVKGSSDEEIEQIIRVIKALRNSGAL